MNKPDPALFSMNSQIGEYEADFDVRGTISVTINARSLDDARGKANDMCDDEDFGLELDQADDIRAVRVRQKPPMYLVMRGGVAMQVSRLLDGDIPRQPTEYEAREMARQATQAT